MKLSARKNEIPDLYVRFIFKFSTRQLQSIVYQSLKSFFLLELNVTIMSKADCRDFNAKHQTLQLHDRIS